MKSEFRILFTSIILLFSVIVISSSAFGQDLLLIKDKLKKADAVLRVGKTIKVKTIGDFKLRGELVSIQDSSITMLNFPNVKTEIPLKDIQFIYARSANGWKTAVGVLLGIASIEMTALVAIGIANEAKTKQNPSQLTKDNPIPGFVGLAVIGLPALYAGTFFALLYKKKYDVQNRYEILILKDR